VPLVRLRWRCASCRSTRIDMVVTSRDNPPPEVASADAALLRRLHLMQTVAHQPLVPAAPL
jgi:hypothetical protein